MTDFLECTCEYEKDRFTIHLAGVLTVGRVSRLAEAIGEARRASVRWIVLDLAGLVSLDAAGFSFLKANVQFFTTKAARLRLVGLAPELSHMADLGPEDRRLLASWTVREVEECETPVPAQAVDCPEREPGDGFVLLVDDEPLVLDFMANYLAYRGFKVIKAAGGREALEAMERHDEQIRLAVVDFMMPEMSGIELVEALTARSTGLRVILTSGVGAETLDRMNHPGIHGRLQKPFYGSLLEAAIRAALCEEG